ncbi:MAG: ErfK/YbiS/YcfS/YnhG family protein [Synergistales bacterium 53_16]|nr:MAG: ErfK/YbiS/YcfS/YnhG family protein [Synergistales bacterium 53_16]
MGLFRRRPTVDFRRKSPWPRRILLLLLVAAVAGLGIYVSRMQFGGLAAIVKREKPEKVVSQESKMPELPPEYKHDSRAWVHDFGEGPVEGAYGPWFIRLKTGWQGIGIHGTHDPSTLGTMTTEGCIRMKNEHLLEILEHVGEGTLVVIDP